MQLIPKITTQRLIIRPFQKDDLQRFLEFMLDPASTEYLMFTDEQKTKPGATKLLEMIIDSYQSSQPINSLAIELKKEGYIGSCGISPIAPEVVECYYSINIEYRGNGYAAEAIRYLIEYVFSTAMAKEVRAYMSPDNPYSEKVAIKSGMKLIGLQKHPVFGNMGLLFSKKIGS